MQTLERLTISQGNPKSISQLEFHTYLITKITNNEFRCLIGKVFPPKENTQYYGAFFVDATNLAKSQYSKYWQNVDLASEYIYKQENIAKLFSNNTVMNLINKTPQEASAFVGSIIDN